MPRRTPAYINGHLLRLEIAATPEERRKGLSERSSVPDGTGMLFLFPTQGYHAFWMKDTYVPLVIYWLDIDGTVLDFAALLPQALQTTAPSSPASAAVEVPLTWANLHKVHRGDRFTFPIL